MDVIQVGSTLISAFGGTFAAFLLEQRRRQRQARQGNRAAGQHALFVLISQYTALRNLTEQHLDPNRAHGVRWALPALPAVPQALTLNMASLLFLLDEGGKADILNHLMVGEAKFLNVLELLRERATWHAEFQHKVEQAFPERPPTWDVAELEGRVGPRIVATLKTLTEALYSGSDGALRTNRENFTRLRAGLEELFPGERFVNYEPFP